MTRERPICVPRPRAARSPVPAFYLYGESLRAPSERLIHVETIAARSQLHDWVIRPHRHRDLHQILMTKRGRVEVTLDGRTETMTSPVAIVVPAGVIHAFRFQAGTDGLVISYAPTLARELAAPSDGLLAVLERAGAIGLARQALNATDLWVVGQLLLREFGRSAPGRHAALRGLLGALFANLLRLIAGGVPETAATGRSAGELVARYRALLEAKFRQPRTVAEYAMDLAVSTATLRRACVAAVGQTPIEMLHTRRLIEAERQLRYTSMTVTQIAYYLGFEDPAYFSRFFLRRAGCSPRAFRAHEVSDAGAPHHR